MLKSEHSLCPTMYFEYLVPLSATECVGPRASAIRKITMEMAQNWAYPIDIYGF